MSVKIENQIVKEEVNDVKQYLSFSCILIKCGNIYFFLNTFLIDDRHI